MKEFYAEFTRNVIRGMLLPIAIFAALFCAPWVVMSRLLTAFLRNEPLVIAPGYEIKLP